MTGPWKTSFFINFLPLPGDHNERHRAGCSEDFTGAASGKATPQLTSTADFSEMISGLDYAAAERVGIGIDRRLQPEIVGGTLQHAYLQGRDNDRQPQG